MRNHKHLVKDLVVFQKKTCTNRKGEFAKTHHCFYYSKHWTLEADGISNEMADYLYLDLLARLNPHLQHKIENAANNPYLDKDVWIKIQDFLKDSNCTTVEEANLYLKLHDPNCDFNRITRLIVPLDINLDPPNHLTDTHILDHHIAKYSKVISCLEAVKKILERHPGEHHIKQAGDFLYITSSNATILDLMTHTLGLGIHPDES